MKIFISLLFPAFFLAACTSAGENADRKPSDTVNATKPDTLQKPEPVEAGLDTALFNKIQLHLVHDKPSTRWPVNTEYPLPGALLPFNRVVAYYGNFYSAGMGILGELPPDEMLEKLQGEVNEWHQADSLIPVIPAIHYIAVTAQRAPGKGNTYRARMPGKEIERAIELAGKINGIVFLDVQVGHSSLQSELPALEKWLKLPNVHLGIDAEYSMKGGQVPSSAIGTFDAADINYATGFLSDLVKENDLIPKILVVHRFTQGMITNASKIKTLPEVQIVMHMDGFGGPAKKIDSYRLVAREPVQFMGMKIFYKNDKAGGRLMEKDEILKLVPSPIYIQYQ